MSQGMSIVGIEIMYEKNPLFSLTGDIVCNIVMVKLKRGGNAYEYS